MPTTLILGAGVFGASTAYHLSKSLNKETDRIILLDRAQYPDDPATTPPAPGPGASWDWNKIIRADYTDVDYTTIMLDGIREWQTSPVFKPYYFQTGVVWMDRPEDNKAVAENYVKAGGVFPEGATLMSCPEAQAKGYFPEAKLTDQSVLVNPAGGWAMAKEATASAVREAVAGGVEYVSAEVVRAKREGESGKCVGVELEDGSVVEADRVIVCLGAGSIRFLEASGADLAVEDRVRSGAVLSACIEGGLDTSKFPQVGCLFQENYEGGGFLPKGPRSPAKIYYDLPVQRWIKHPVSGNRVAVPPPGPLLDMWTAPQAMRDRLRNVAKLFFGDEVGSQLVLTDFRCCWDMYTPSEDFIISPLGLKDSPVGGLYMATGGSFHGFKFLPVIGKYVIDMLEGRLDQKLASKWNWNRDWDHSKRRLAQDAVAVGFEINE